MKKIVLMDDRRRGTTRAMHDNLAGRAGAWSAAHWKKALFGAILATVIAVAVGTVVGLNVLGDSDTGSGQTARAEKLLSAGDFKSPATESVLVQARDGKGVVTDASFQAAISTVVQAVSQQPVVRNIRSPLQSPRGLVSKDGHSALVQFDITGKADDAKKKIEPVLQAVAGAQKASPSYRVEEFGLASANFELQKVFDKDFQRAEYTSLPLTLIILLVAFGALVAAAAPVLLAFLAVLGAIGVFAVVSQLFPAANFVNSVILLIGMAVGVDYSLFYLLREREERRRGRDLDDALHTAAGTSGQAVLISGLTVLIAMAGMLFAGNKIFTSMGLATMVVVAIAVMASLTALPALLHKLGDRVDKGRIPFLGRRGGNPRLWSAVLTRVLRRPWIATIVAGGALIALALPTLTLHTKLPSFTDLPKNLAIVKTFDRITTAFPGAPAPASVVIKAPDVTAPQVRQAIDGLEQRALATKQMNPPISVRVSPDHTLAVVDVPLVGPGDSGVSFTALKTLRNDVLPATIGRLGEDVDYAVSGQTAGTYDFNRQMKQRAPIVFAFVLGLAFVLLLLTFRSIVIPIKAILLNLLSVAAAYGVLVLVFQHTWAEGILGFESNGAIVSWLPLFLFVILFGLSMDYHVFVLSRVKELVDQGEKTEDAVLHGITRTAGAITSAAAVMVAVFGIFATLSTIDMKQMGFGLAVAILVDATVIRAVLLPAAMKLLGEWNWYLPGWLEWLPSLGPAESASPELPAPVD
jgi:RND superfamily putative drug exporter